jgi:YHS domain-containing protein
MESNSFSYNVYEEKHSVHRYKKLLFILCAIIHDLCHKTFKLKHQTSMNIMKTTDPVCKMECLDEMAAFKSEYNGKTYCFCSLSCKKEFDKNPKKYLESLRGL